MICPYCDKEMESGYLVFRDPLVWSKKKKIVATLPFGKDSMIFSPDSSSPFGGNRKAYRCTCCKKIIMDYEKEEKNCGA